MTVQLCQWAGPTHHPLYKRAEKKNQSIGPIRDDSAAAEQAERSGGVAENRACTLRHEQFTMPLGLETIGALGISASHCLPCCSHRAWGGVGGCSFAAERLSFKGMNWCVMAAGKGEDMAIETRRK